MKKEVVKLLKEWALEYIKNKDLFTNSIRNIQEKENEINVEYENKKQRFLIIPYIEDIGSLIKITNEGEMFISLITFNSKKNLDVIIKNWKDISKDPKFSIFFVNPLSNLEKKWIIYPFTHAKISEGANLKKGLLSLFSTVEEINEKEIN